MTRDNNVTPLRPRQPDRRPGTWKDPHMQAMLVHGLTVGCFGLFFITPGGLFDYVAIAVGFAAIAIAASKRDQPPGWAATHHDFALRTMLIGGAIWMLSMIIGIVPLLGGLVVFVIKVAVLAWAGVRSAVGVLRARDRAPISNPRTPFI